MTAVISPMLGNNCRFWLEGRCAYEELLNPGLHDAWRCTEEQRIMKLYDRFMEQADGFSLDTDTAVHLWEQRLGKEPPLGALCSQYCGGAKSCQGCSSCDDSQENKELQALLNGGLPTDEEYAILMNEVKKARLHYAKQKTTQAELAYFVARERLKEADAAVNRALELTRLTKAREARINAPAAESLAGEALVDCLHCYGGLCAMLLPVCEAMCSRFVAAARKK